MEYRLVWLRGQLAVRSILTRQAEHRPSHPSALAAPPLFCILKVLKGGDYWSPENFPENPPNRYGKSTGSSKSQGQMRPRQHNNIEFIHDPPLILKKAMQWQHAQQLLTEGRIRLTCILEYRKHNSDKPWQTDPYEDISIELDEDVVCQSSSATPPFVWCGAALEADSTRLLGIDPHYDTIVTITDPSALFRRIRFTVCEVAPWARFQAARVSYNKGGPSTAYFWGKSVFQKHAKYSYQEEYRFAFHEPPGLVRENLIKPKYQGKRYVDLIVGSCASMLTIESVEL